MREKKVGTVIVVTDSPHLWKAHLRVDRGASVIGSPWPDTRVEAAGTLPTSIRNTMQYRVYGVPEATVAVVRNSVPKGTHVKFLTNRQFTDSGLPEWKASRWGEEQPTQMVILDRSMRNDGLDFTCFEQRAYIMLDSQRETWPSQVDGHQVKHIMCYLKPHRPSRLFEVEEGDDEWIIGFKQRERLMAGIDQLWSGFGLGLEEAERVATLVRDTKMALKQEFLTQAFGNVSESELLAAMRLSSDNNFARGQKVVAGLLSRLEPFIVKQLEYKGQVRKLENELDALEELGDQLIRLAPDALGIPGAFQADLRHHLNAAPGYVSGINTTRAKLGELYVWLVNNRGRVAEGGDAYFVELYDEYLARVGPLTHS